MTLSSFTVGITEPKMDYTIYNKWSQIQNSDMTITEKNEKWRIYITELYDSNSISKEDFDFYTSGWWKFNGKW